MLNNAYVCVTKSLKNFLERCMAAQQKRADNCLRMQGYDWDNNNQMYYKGRLIND